MSYGTVPDRARFLRLCAERRDEDGEPDPVESFPMKIVDAGEWAALARAINAGIDSHLEAVRAEERAYGKGCPGSDYITIADPASLHTLIRRLCEDGSEGALDLASSIVYVVGIEWI